MSKFITTPLIVAVTASSVVAGILVFLTSVAPLASAEPRTAQPLASVQKSNARALQAEEQRTAPAEATGSACSARSWPNYDQGCQFDRRPSGDMVRTVRIVDLEIRSIPARR